MKCVLLGCGEETKGHTLYGIAQNKVIYIRDVEFNEKIKVPYPESKKKIGADGSVESHKGKTGDTDVLIAL